jgi:hypothetical protein
MAPAVKPPRKPVAKRTGRPAKQAGEVAGNVLTTRWTDSDKAALDALIADERARLEAAGILRDSAARVAAADVLRSLVRQEVERRGLVAA